MEFNYQIGDKTYIQRPLVLGQVRQLLDLLQDIIIPGNIDIMGIVRLLGDLLPEALAIILTEKDHPLKGKNIAELATEIEFAIAPEQCAEVIENFLSCNPTASLLERLAGTASSITTALTGLKNSASSLPAETSPDEMKSSGETP